MYIEQFFNIEVIDHPDDVSQKYDTQAREFDYCIPLCHPDGMFVEFGVWKGTSINHMAQTNPNMTFYGFDTFEGINEIWDIGGKKVDMRKMAEGGVPKVESNVVLVKGLFEDSLVPWLEQHEGNISFINLDADLYSSTKYVLDTLNSRIVPGTIIRFDELSDWSLFNQTRSAKHTYAKYTKWEEGEWKALNEWLEECDREVKPIWRTWFQAAGVIVTK